MCADKSCTKQEIMDSDHVHLTQLETKTVFRGVDAASTAEGYYELTRTHDIRLEADGSWHCKLGGKRATESHITPLLI
jgi:hypothetical protein